MVGAQASLCLRHISTVLVLLLLAPNRASTEGGVCGEALGLQDGGLPDASFSASSSMAGWEPWKARLNHADGWRASSQDTEQYLLVDLGRVTRITSLGVQGVRYGIYPLQVRLFYSQDGLVWTRYLPSTPPDSLSATTGWNVVTNITLDPPIQAQHLAVNPYETSYGPALRLEIYGCQSNQTTSTRDTASQRTPVLQDIRDTQEWLLSESPYVISGPITIRPGGHLIIRSGVKVIFTAESGSLIVMGRLEATGMQGLPVTMEAPLPPLHAGAHWQGLVLYQGGRLSLERVEVRHAKTAVTGTGEQLSLRRSRFFLNDLGLDITAGSGSLPLEGVMVDQNRLGGMRIDAAGDATLTVRDSVFFGNGQEGVSVWQSLSLTLENCSFSGNRGRGLDLRGPSVLHLDIRRSAFLGNRQEGLYASFTWSFVKMNVQSCLFQDNGYEGVYFYSYEPKQGSSCQILNSVISGNAHEQVDFRGDYFVKGNFTLDFSGNNMTGPVRSAYFAAMNVYLGFIDDGNVFTFSNNRLVNLSSALFVNGHVWRSGYKLLVANNTFIGMTGNYAVKVDKLEEAVISGNVFVNNTPSAVLQVASWRTRVANNVFINPQASHDLAMIANGNRSLLLDARHNYWGVTRPVDVRSRVCDFYCDMDKARALLSPYFLDANLQEFSGPRLGEDYVADQTRGLGGILTSDLTLGLGNQSLWVGRTLIVPRGVTLTVSPGVTLSFSPDTGIFVEGSLLVNGEVSNLVILRRLGSENWHGIVANSSGISIRHAMIQDAVTALEVAEGSNQSLHLDDVTISDCSFALSVANDVTGILQLRVENSRLLSPVSALSCRLRMHAEVLGTAILGGGSRNFYVSAGRLDLLMANSSLNITSGEASVVVCPLDPANAWEGGGNVTVVNSTVRVRKMRYREGVGLKIVGSYVNRTQVLAASESSGEDVTWDFTNVALENCELEAEDSEVLWLVRISGAYSAVQVTGCRFRGPGQLLVAELETFPASQVLVANSSFSGGNSDSGGTIRLASDVFLNRTTQFWNNSFVNCSGNVLVLANCRAALHRNVFLNPGAAYSLRLEEGGPIEDDVNATHNHWGSRDAKVVSRQIYDAQYDIKLRKVAFIPFYEDAGLRQLTYLESTFVGANSTVGGQVGGDVTLTAAGSPYLVMSSILVDRTDRLTIEAGVTLLLMPGLTLNVKGRLYVRGTAENPVMMRPETNGRKWFGIRLIGQRSSPSESLRSQVRLVGGRDEREGRVEVKKDGAWGTVCDDRFDVADAKVACAMLGYDPDGGAQVFPEAHFGRGSGTVHYGNLHCMGQEPSLFHCARSTFSCWHGGDVGVRCLGDALVPPAVGDQNEVQIENLVVNDTTHGLMVSNNVSRMVNVTSTFSSTYGLHVYYSGNERPPLHVQGLTVNSSGSHGVRILGSSGLHAQPVTVSDCRVEGAGGHGVQVQYSLNVTLQNCHVARSAQTGVTVSDVAFGHLRLASSSFHANAKAAVAISNEHYADADISVDVSDNNFTSHDVRDYWRYLLPLVDVELKSGNAALLVRGNTFLGNNARAVVLALTELGEARSLHVSHNSFRENQGPAVEMYLPGVVHSLRFDGNALRECAVPGTEALVKVDLRRVSRLNASLDNNTFTDNSAQELLSLTGRSGELAAPVQVRGNRLQDNRGQAALATSVFSLQAHFNVFRNPAMDCELAPPAFQPRLRLNASLNLWGVSSPVQVARRTCGFDVNMTRGYVEYLPFLTSLDPKVVSSNRHDDFFLPGALGGDVLSEIRLEPAASPFHLQRSVFVRKGGQLQVPGGVEMRFAEGTGLFVEGQLQVGDNSGRPTRMSGQSGRPWHGVVLAEIPDVPDVPDVTLSPVGDIDDRLERKKRDVHNSSALQVTVSRLVGVVIENAVTGLTLDREAELVGVRVIDSLEEGVILKEGAQDVLDLGGLGVEGSGGHGVLAESRQRSRTLANFTVKNSGKSGLVLDDIARQVLVIQDAVFEGNGGNGLVVIPSWLLPSVTVRRCRFREHHHQAAMAVDSYAYNYANQIHVADCQFFNNTAGSLDILLRTRYSTVDYNVTVENNMFEYDGGVRVVVMSRKNVTLANNVFRHGDAGQQCYVQVEAGGDNQAFPLHRVLISSNTFQNISGACVVRLKTDPDSSTNGSFLYNLLETSTASQGVVLLESPHFNFSHNRFHNPESTYELRVAVRGNGTVPAMNNWWGTGTGAEARVLDRRQETGLLAVLMEPRLPTPDFDCSQVQNCSQHGECVRPSGCRCQAGWQGEACDQVTCAEVNQCSNHGACVGPNVCACSEGWEGRSCSSATCLSVGNCGNGERGFCVLPDQCRCLAQFRGSNCSECAPNRWGADCLPCPLCVQGTCDLQKGGCVCWGDNWAGPLCQRCAEAFYGEDCGPYPSVLHVLPSSSPDTGGVQVHVRGHNFPPAPSGNYTCRFGAQTVTGERLGEDHVVCRSPRQRAGVVHLEVSADGLTFTTNKTAFTFFESCPPSACGREFVPRRGRCHFGECACSLPWSGPDCDVELLPPVISPVASLQTLVEGAPYTLQLNVTQGEPPITWSLVSGPGDLELGRTTGLVLWAWPTGSDVNHTVQVQATNHLGMSRVTWVLHVPMTYRVEVTGVEPADAVLPGPRTLTLRGSVVFYSDDSANVTALVHVELRNQARNQTVQVAVRPPKTDFQVQLFPHPADSGLFLLDARHPGVSTFEAKVRREVQALRCVPPVTSVRGYMDLLGQTAFPRLASLLNTGLRPLHNVTVTIMGVEPPLTSAWVVVNDVRLASGDVFMTSLEPSANVTFDLTAVTSQPGSYQLILEFRSALGTVTRMGVQIITEIRTPLLVLDPKRLSASIERGKQLSLQVGVSNLGEAEASNVRLLLPPGEPRLAVAAFSVDNATDVSAASYDVSSTNASDVSSNAALPSLRLGPGDSASLTVVVTTAPTEPLGELRGSMAVRADSASVSLPYVIYVTSSATVSLSIRVEDEYTYFAQGAPLVTGAEVTLRNPRRGLTLTSFTSNSSGLVEFEDVPEDTYTLTAQARGHAPYTSIILLSPDKPRLTIFLRRVAVKYTWTVTPTTYEDKYVIQLDSTFETRVPMPVVTVEPMTVDLLPYELGQRDVMEFVITNHGLIQAENVRFSLPSSPEMTFVMEGGPIGILPANSSIVTSIRVTSRARSDVRRRRAAGGGSICGMVVLYDIKCGTARTSGISITLTRQYPGSPPQPCGRLWTPRGGGSGGGSIFGGSVTYRAVTPLTCDCLKNLFEKCILDFIPKVKCGVELLSGKNVVDTVVDTCLPAFFPVVACAKDIFDLPKKVIDGGARGAAWGTLDIAMSCLVGLKTGRGGRGGSGGGGGRGGGGSSGGGSSSGGRGSGGDGDGGDGGAGNAYNGLKCFDAAGQNCGGGGGGRKRREVSTEIITQAIDAGKRLRNIVEMADEVLGDDRMYELEGRAWLDQLNLAQDPDTPGGTLLTSQEVDVITSALNNTAQVETLRQFLWRWNNTMAAWENGTLLQAEGRPGFINYTAIQARVDLSKSDNEAARRRGYESVFHYFDGAMKTYDEARRRDEGPERGVCARVRLRILQELTLTREGFNARLELENGEEGALEGVRVTIEIGDSLSRLPSNHLFSIGALELEGLTGVDGSGTLQSGQTGSAQWLIAPYSTAANVTDTLYDVGGRLQYSVNGQQFNVPLLPDTITVRPNPSLVLHYFHEKFVAGDDPFTSDVIEPSLPFVLAVLVTNQAVGVARAVRITSGQPQIIENEKGLLVNFRVTGASVQGGPVAPSLAVNLGDIGPGQARVAAWQLTCSLKGKFYNFTATFENINPLGDPQLSIMDSVDYHELIHAVRVTVGSDATQAPDDLDDFLVNDVIDVDDFPDRLYQSHDGLVSWPVAVAASSLALERQEQRGRRSYKYVTMTAACVNVTHTNFSYSRVVNQVTRDTPAETLLLVTRDDGRDVMVDKNAWLTSYFHDEFYFHLFDSVQDHVTSQRSRLGQADTCTVTYTAVFGPRNLYRPRLNRENLTSPLYVSSRQYSSDLLTLSATDTDGDDVTFSVTSATPVPVVVDARTGVVRNTAPLLAGSRFLLTLAVTDDGIPTLSDSLDVEMRVGDSTGSETTQIVTGHSSPSPTESPSTPYSSTGMTLSTQSSHSSIATDATAATNSNVTTEAATVANANVTSGARDTTDATEAATTAPAGTTIVGSGADGLSCFGSMLLLVFVVVFARADIV